MLYNLWLCCLNTSSLHQ